MKKAARDLDDMPRIERDFERVEVWIEKIATARLPRVRPDDLRAAWARSCSGRGSTSTT
jgi:hypothetical protein